jgi:hypothetical protein
MGTTLLSFVDIATGADQFDCHRLFCLVEAKPDQIVVDAKAKRSGTDDPLDIGVPIRRAGGQLFEPDHYLAAAIRLNLGECFLCSASESQFPREGAFLSFQKHTEVALCAHTFIYVAGGRSSIRK